MKKASMIVPVKAIHDFYKLIRHGDAAHKAWLKERFEEFFDVQIEDEEAAPVVTTDERRADIATLKNTPKLYMMPFKDEVVEALWEAFSDATYSAGFIRVDENTIKEFDEWLWDKEFNTKCFRCGEELEPGEQCVGC